MERTIVIKLSGHGDPFRLDQDAYDALRRYLDEAADRLQSDPDRADVLDDLERSVGDKLAASVGSDDRIVTAADIEGVLEQIGTVDTGDDRSGENDATERVTGRRFRRIREGQQLAGVCTGIAAYTEVDVTWVRSLFVLATIFTAGVFAFVYVALVFIMPVDSRHPLRRIREGQMIAGVSTGLAAYAEIDVAWVRTAFVLGTIFTAGLFAVVYVALVLIMPLDPKREVRPVPDVRR